MPEHTGERLDQVVPGGADDEGLATRVLLAVDLGQHLGVDPRQDPGQDLRPHALDLPRGDVGKRIPGHLQDLVGLLVGGAPEAVPEMISRPLEDLDPGDQPTPASHPRELHPARPRHQGLVKVEECGCRRIAHAADGIEPSLRAGPAGGAGGLLRIGWRGRRGVALLPQAGRGRGSVWVGGVGAEACAPSPPPLRPR